MCGISGLPILLVIVAIAAIASHMPARFRHYSMLYRRVIRVELAPHAAPERTESAKSKTSAATFGCEASPTALRSPRRSPQLDLQARRNLHQEEEISVVAAQGRVLAEPLSAPANLPAVDCAAVDGYALRSSETEGASDYNPLLFTLDESRDAPSQVLPSAGAMVAPAGSPLPAGADAVLPFDATQLRGRVLEIFAAVAAGAGVERRGQHVRAGAAFIEG